MYNNLISRRTFILGMKTLCSGLLCAGCSRASDATPAATVDSPADKGYEVDYGQSAIYTQQDMDDAITVIMNEFDTWTGCTMQRISYGSDDACNAENLAWLNELAEANPLDLSGDYVDCIQFLSDFHSPSEEEAEGTAWNPDSDYTSFSWWLARPAGGFWELITWGYG